MSATGAVSLAPSPSAAAASLAALAELESLRHRTLIRAAWTIGLAIATLPLAIAPLAFVAWLGMELPPESPGAVAQAQWHTLVTPYLDRVGVALFAAPVVWLVATVVCLRAFVWRASYRYRAEYKQRVLTAVCEQHYPGLRYAPGEGIAWRVLDDSGLFPFVSDVYSSDDRFSGRVGATDVCFAEAVAQLKRTRGWGENRDTVYETFFRGIIFSADFNKHFAGTTRLLPRGEPGRHGAGEEPAHLEDPRFSALFDVWTTSQIEVRYLLSPALMEHFAELHRRFPKLRAKFAAEHLLLLLPDPRDRFEPSLFARAASSNQLDGFVADVARVLGVVTTLDLDTRIWSKS